MKKQDSTVKKKPDHSRLRFIIILVVLIGLIGAISYGVYRWHKSDEQKNELVAHGNVDIRQVELGFRVSGRIAEMAFDEGDEVKAGDLLAKLDKLPFEHSLAQAEAEVAQMQANITERQATFENAKVFAQRQKELVSSGSIARQEYDNASAQMKQAEAALSAAGASLQAAQAAVKTAQTNLDDAEILAPNDGVIFTRAREPGAIVSSGASVYTLSLHHPVWVRAYIAEPDLGRVKPGMEVSVKTDTEGAPALKGQIGFYLAAGGIHSEKY
jgi:HlyD family secretion protein